MNKLIETERLVLRELTINDAEFVFELLNTSEYKQNIADRNINTLADAENYLLTGPLLSYKQNEFGLWAIVLKDTNEVIGMCGLINRDTLDDIDVGYALMPEYAGRGLATEAAQAALNYGFQQLNLKRIVGIVNPANAASQKVLQKIGLKFEKMIVLKGDTNEVMLFRKNRAD